MIDRSGRRRPQTSATRRPVVRGPLTCGRGSPLLCRAQDSSRGPAEILPDRPSTPFQSRANVRGDRPDSTAEMITGHASSVDSNRARILLDGISLSEYPTAPSIRISVFSPAAFAYRFGSQGPGRSISGTSRSSSSTSVFMAFALRGAPCGDDPRPWAADRGYHDDELIRRRTPDSAKANLMVRMFDVRKLFEAVAIQHVGSFFERHSMLAQVGLRLLGVPVVPRHRGTVATAAYPGLIR